MRAFRVAGLKATGTGSILIINHREINRESKLVRRENESRSKGDD